MKVKVLLILFLLLPFAFIKAESFSVGPGTSEYVLEKGGSARSQINIVNNSDQEQRFIISVEDLEGSSDGNILFLGEEEGQYSLKNFLKPEQSEITLKPGEQAFVPLLIKLPTNIDAGGHFAMVAVSPIKPKLEGQGVQITTRLGTLHYVRVLGDVKEMGILNRFSAEADPNKGKKYVFKTYFKNNGNVHLAPSGKIEIYNWLGNKLASLEVKKFFVLPNSLVMQETAWEDQRLWPGPYIAKVELGRGYYNNLGQIIIDKSYAIFWSADNSVLNGFFVFVILAVLFFFFAQYKRRKKYYN